MEYNKIFQPQTLEKLNKRSQENLKKMMGDKTLMQTMMSSTKLLQEIMAIEAPYKEQLEQLAVQMVEDMYPIILEDNINLDAKIVSMGDVNKSLDEIKINKPGNKLPLFIENEYENQPYFQLKDGRFFGHYFKDKVEFQDVGEEYDELLQYLKNKYIDYTESGEFIFIKIKDTKIQKNINENSPEAKRRVINGITQGAALNGTFSFYMFKEYLDAIDDTLVEKYNQLMKEVFGVYDDDNAVAMFLNAIAQGQKTGGGSSKVIINEIKINKPTKIDQSKEFEKIISKLEDEYPDYNDTKIFNLANKEFKKKFKYGVGEKLNENQQGPTIRARAICFPMLVHEIIKGLYELVSLQGFSGTKDQNQAVVDKVDKLENEPHDLKYGKFIYEALNNIFADSDYNDSRIKEFFFTEVYQMGDTEFVEFIENAINEQLSPFQKKWVDQTLKEISLDLKADDWDSEGLDEIVINKPIYPYFNKWQNDIIKDFEGDENFNIIEFIKIKDPYKSIQYLRDNELFSDSDEVIEPNINYIRFGKYLNEIKMNK